MTVHFNDGEARMGGGHVVSGICILYPLEDRSHQTDVLWNSHIYIHIKQQSLLGGIKNTSVKSDVWYA